MNGRKNLMRSIARMGVLSAMSLILVVIESMLPPLFPLAPGAKIGLGNIVILLAIMTQGYPQAFAVLLVKCFFGAVYGGNVFGLVYSLSAGLASFAAMSALVQFGYKKISILAVSIVGAVVHNTVQTIIAAAIVGTMSILAMLPFMLIASVIAGLAVGLCVYCTVRFVPAKILLGRT